MAATSSLILLFLTTGSLPLFLTTATPIDDICRQTKEPPCCVTVLKSISTGAGAAQLQELELEYIAIEAAQTIGGQNRIRIHDLLLNAKEPKLQAIYRNCENVYLTALDELGLASVYLLKRSFGKLVRAGGIVGSVVGGCAAAAANNPGLKRGNEDTGLVGQAISIIARNLH